jgi:ferredoxin
MGHLVGKDLYRALGRKVDGLTLRAPWNQSLHAILKELYSEEEAELLVAMPFGLATLDRIAAVTGLERAHLERVLEQLCSKGLVFDLLLGDVYHYLPSPMAIGIFELTMMRTGEGLESARRARQFSEYFESGELWHANAGGGRQLLLMRTLAHEEALATGDHVEVLDYERAVAIVEAQDRFAVGLCSCRHEKDHLGTRPCQVPLATCTSMGNAADYLVRRNLARRVDKAEMLDHLASAREMGLVLNADNVQRNVSFICCCCGCCCNVLLGVSRFGYPHVVVTSSYLARPDLSRCEGCGKCKKACPINAISLARHPAGPNGSKAHPVVDEGICLGCGVCALRCPSGALKLHLRQQRVLTPETTFERVILQCLEAGTLQNQLFDDPGRMAHRFMRAFVGAFLRLPPLKRALLSKALRSRFLAALRAGAGATAAAVS